MAVLCRRRIVAIDRANSLAYLHAVITAWREHAVAVPVEPSSDPALAGISIEERVRTTHGGGWFADRISPDDNPSPSQISFTSGTTGTPKPILLSRRALSDVTQRVIGVMRLDSSIREYIGVPVTFSFGLGRARAIAAVGGASYLPSHGFRPDEVAHMLREGTINALSAVPSQLRLIVLQRNLFEKVGNRLLWLESGSQYMSAEEKAIIHEIFPNARIVQHYGLTEASRTTFLDVSTADNVALESIGAPTGSVELKIDAEGRICIRGPHLADGIIDPEGLVPLTDPDGWLRTNDLGEIKGGLVYFKGRTDHLINVGGIKVPAELFEQRLAQQIGPDAASIAVAARTNRLRGNTVMVAHLRDVEVRHLHKAARTVAMSFGLGAADLSLVEVAEIPRTSTGKISRTALIEAYGKSPTGHSAKSESGSLGSIETVAEREAEIARIWQDVLGVPSVSRHESFFDIGGDSLSAVSAILRMEQSGLPNSITQQVFAGRTIVEIAAGSNQHTYERSIAAKTSDAINATRGILVLIVIAAHWMPFFFERAGALRALAFEYSDPLFRFGTPGFAMIFGVGLGYFQMAMVKRNPLALRAKLKANTLIVALGIGLSALLHAIEIWLVQAQFGPQWPTELFYSVLLFYLIMVPMTGLVLWIVRQTPYAICNSLLVAVLALQISHILTHAWGDLQTDGILNLGRLMLVANYSFPRMLAYVSVGFAIGLWIRQHNDRSDLARFGASVGAVLLLGGIVGWHTVGTGETWFPPIKNPAAIAAYAGIVLLLFSGFFSIAFRTQTTEDYPSLIRVLIVIGLLSLVAYVTHGLVMNAKSILVALGLPYVAAIAIPVTIFVGASVIAIRHLNRLYFGAKNTRWRPHTANLAPIHETGA